MASQHSAPSLLSLDTSALVEILSSSTQQGRFVEAVQTRNASITIPNDAVAEVFSVPRAYLTERLARFAALLAALPGRVAFLRGINDLIRHEFDRESGPLPAWPLSDFERLMGTAPEIVLARASEPDSIGCEMNAKKDEAFTTAMSLRSEGGRGIDQSELEGIAATIQLRPDVVNVENPVVNAFARRFRVTPEALVARLADLPILRAYADVCVRQMYGDLLSDALAPRAGVFRTRASGQAGRGDWIDNAIIAASARADVLVTEDQRILGKCEVLHRLEVTRVRAVALSEFAENRALVTTA